MDSFDPKDPKFELKIDDKYGDIKPAIIDEMERHVFANRVVDARKQKKVKFRKEVYLSEDFKELWDKIKQRTRYRVAFDTKELITLAVERINGMEKVKPAQIDVTKVGVDVSEAGVSTDRTLEEKSVEQGKVKVLPDLLAYLQKETELTRHTLVQILVKSKRLHEFLVNPQQFMTLVAREISRALNGLIIEGIKYEKIPSCHWEMSRIEQDAEEGIVRYLNNLYEVQNQEKSLFDGVEFDSQVEKQFAKDLDNNENVRLFVKLPGWFKVDTPIGAYNPDWAFVTERDEKLYFVRETKSTTDKEELRSTENKKIDCGRRHFETLEVDYDVVTKLSEVRF